MEQLKSFVESLDLSRLAQDGRNALPFETLELILLPLLLAFVLGQMIAWVYSWTHRGVSYSRSFTQSLVLITMVVALVLLVIGNNIFTAFGLIGALAIIRFRNVLKDTRDTAFVFMSLVVGMAIGAQRYEVAIVGSGALLLVTVYLHLTDFGSTGRFDGHLTCLLQGHADEGHLMRFLKRHCANVKRISTRSGGAGAASESVYQVRLRNNRRGDEFLDGLRELDFVEDAALILRDELVEI